MFDLSKPVILLTFDDNYVNQTMNLILSISKFHKDEVSYICMCPSLKRENIDLLMSVEESLQVRCYDFLGEIDPGSWPVCALFRLFAPWLLEETVQKVLYMDSDIICAGSLEKLLKMLPPWIAMCPEINMNINPFYQRTVQEFLPAQIYCNSGVCIFNLSALRKEYSPQRICDALLELRPKLQFPDQDFLNFYFRGRIEYLNSYRYNFIAHDLKGAKTYQRALDNCSLIHFAGKKPWTYRAQLYQINLYRKYSEFPPMKKMVRKAYWKSICYSPIRMAAPLVVRYCWPLADAFLKWRDGEKRG